MSRIHIGNEEHEYLAIYIQGREHVEYPVDYYDNNWLTCIIDVAAGGFRATLHSSLLTEDLVRLHEIATHLLDWSENQLYFSTLEDWLRIDFFLDERGSIDLLGELREHASGNRLRFVLKLDQSYLPLFICNLERAIAEYPVIGSPQST
jgi:hypothetical protein